MMSFQLTALLLPLLLISMNSIILLSAASAPYVTCPKGTALNTQKMMGVCGTQDASCSAAVDYCSMLTCCDTVCPAGYTVASGYFNGTDLTWCQPDGTCPYSSAKCIDGVCCNDNSKPVATTTTPPPRPGQDGCSPGYSLDYQQMIGMCGLPIRCPGLDCSMLTCCHPACPVGYTVASGAFNGTELTYCQPDGTCPYSSAKCIDTICCNDNSKPVVTTTLPPPRPGQDGCPPGTTIDAQMMLARCGLPTRCPDKDTAEFCQNMLTCCIPV